MTDVPIRPAVTADVPAVKAVIDAAFHPSIERIGLVPSPMAADHAANVAAGLVCVGLVCVAGERPERRADGPYDRIHDRKHLNSPLMG